MKLFQKYMFSTKHHQTTRETAEEATLNGVLPIIQYYRWILRGVYILGPVWRAHGSFCSSRKLEKLEAPLMRVVFIKLTKALKAVFCAKNREAFSKQLPKLFREQVVLEKL